MKNFKSDPYKTSLTICLGFVIIYIFNKNSIFLDIAFVIGVLSLVSKKAGVFIEKIWFKIAQILGYIVPNIVLSCIFYIFLFPISILSRITQNKDLLSLNNKEKSNYIVVNKKFEKDDFVNPW
tara:strand:- start:947 stop:1315 length:369 start_codon:yes stop_codon:yes gene_type:complete